jgi:hypothetical protein
MKRETPASSSSIPRFTPNVLSRGSDDSLIAEGWIQYKPCRVTIDSEASVTIVRPDIVAGLLGRKLSRQYVLQIASGETIPVLKLALVS